MEDFWEEQSKKQLSYIHSISNLSYDKELSIEKSNIEQKKVKSLLKDLNKYYESCIEIGAGTCQWTNLLSQNCRNVLATDTSKGMLSLGKKYIERNHNCKNINYYFGDICIEKNPENAPYDLIFISGLLLYLNEQKFYKILNFLEKYSINKSILILREPVAIKSEYLLNNKYSKELQTIYSAIYRTETKIINNFKKNNFKLLTNDWMHSNGSKFNKWEETRLKLFSFRRT
tara:strand:+ start:6020 stop:6709 length:690 start_codon:yes stop_codon:yes gene_type:complete